MSQIMPTLEQIRENFFRAMLENSWASGGEAMTSVGQPFTKHVSWTDGGDWIVIDRWTSVPASNFSRGSTTIFFCGIPVWFVHFHGEYTKEASKLVKQALIRTWEARRFRASRGEIFSQGGLTYINDVARPRDGDGSLDIFAKFACYEEVYDADRNRLGWHRVSGMALI
ncbi:MAG: hypothetical protein ABIH67_05615 [Candidatus Uhrbacteria bacterium]